MTPEISAEHNPNQPPYKSRTDYFVHLSMHLFSRVKQDIKFGKLSRRDSENKKLPDNDRGNWINVTEHCLVEAAAAEALGEALGLNQDDIDKLMTATAIHDWDKRIEKNPEQFTAEEIAIAQEAYQKIGVLSELKKATTIEFVEQFFTGNKGTFLQRLLNYIDKITDESDLVSYQSRIHNAAKRASTLENDPKWTEILRPILGPNKGFYDGDKEMGRQEQEEIYHKLLEQGHRLLSPEDVPAFIKAQVEKNYT